MTQPFLTIGMPTLDDYSGVWLTIQKIRTELRRNHLLDSIEFLVINNAERDSRASILLQGDPNKLDEHGRQKDLGFAGKIPNLRILHDRQRTGTAYAKNRVFAEARGEFVVCVDSHVLIDDGAIERLVQHYQQIPSTRDLYSGVLVYDDLRQMQTHVHNRLRGDMWGTWGVAWGCNTCRAAFAVDADQGRAACFSLDMADERLSACQCGAAFPVCGYVGHEPHFIEAGFHRLIEDADPPFEVPGMGMFLFSCRRDAWAEYSDDFHGFGGEEVYIHEKFRQRGDKAYCLPWLKGVHRFGRDVPHTWDNIRMWDKVRNCVIGHLELGIDIARVHQHYVVQEQKLSQSDWDFLLQDPIRHVNPPDSTPLQRSTGNRVVENILSAQRAFDLLHAQPHDLNEHMPQLRELASQVEHVTELTDRHHSTIAFMAAEPDTLVSYTLQFSDTVRRVAPTVKTDCKWHAGEKSDQVNLQRFESTELLFIDSPHHHKTFEKLYWELSTFGPHVTRWIVLHDTTVYGQRGTDGGPGLLSAIALFLRENPQWFLHSHTDQQHGLTVLGCQAQDRATEPVRIGPGSIDSVAVPVNVFAEVSERWSAAGHDPDCSAAFIGMLQQVQPRMKDDQGERETRAIEFGCGMSTLVFDRNQVHCTTVCPDAAYLDLPTLTGEHVQYETDPTWTPQHGTYFDCIVIRESVVESGVANTVAPLLAPNGVIIIEGDHKQLARELASQLGLTVKSSREEFQLLTPPPEPLGEGPGTELQRMFQEKGFPECQQCRKLARQMNEWGADECRARLDEIVDDILPRAKNWLQANRPWAKALLGAVAMEDTALRHEIRKHVNRAIQAAEKQCSNSSCQGSGCSNPKCRAKDTAH